MPDATQQNAPTSEAGQSVIGGVIFLAAVLVCFAIVGYALSQGDTVEGARDVATTTTTWSEAYSYCDDHEHRIFIGPTDGQAAPSIDVVPYEPSCRRPER